mgnify:CR=1 FL=1
MSNPISRRTFLKCTGASAVALGAAGLLGGCQQSGGDTIVDVKVGDKISNWNGLGVMLTSLFRIDTAPAQEGYEYIAVLVTVVNRTKNQTFNIGAQNLAEINAAYPVPPQENVRCQHLAVQLQLPDLLRVHQPAPAGQRLSAADADGPQGLAEPADHLHAHLCGG